MSSSRIVSILLQAAFWASTPTAVWKSVNAWSNAGDEYCDAFQTPLVLSAALRIDIRGAAMAVVDDAQLGGAGARRIGRLGGAPLRPVERVEALDDDVEGDAGLCAWLLSRVARSGISSSWPAWRVAVRLVTPAVGQEGLGLVDVLGPLRDGRVVVRIALPDDVVVAELGLALEQLLDERRPIER